MKKSYLSIVLAIALSVTAFAGCSGNETADSSQSSTVALATETSAADNNSKSDAKLSEDVKDYTIVKDKNTPLKVNDISNDDFNILLDSVRSYSYLSSDLFKITNLESLCSNPEFRQISVKTSDSDGEDLYYYCVFHNTGNDEIVYLIFCEVALDNSDKTYACANYVTKLDDTITTYPENSFDWYSCIAESDK